MENITRMSFTLLRNIKQDEAKSNSLTKGILNRLPKILAKF